jgi:hypothetical protein
LTFVNGVYPRSRNSAEYTSANGANGPVNTTLRTLLAGPATISSFSGNEKDDDRQNQWRHADIYAVINPTRKECRLPVVVTGLAGAVVGSGVDRTAAGPDGS